MNPKDTPSAFEARLLQPEDASADSPWAFVVLPGNVSARLPRRGRTSVQGSINGEPFTALLEPDGQKSHWLRIDERLAAKAGAVMGEVAQFVIAAMDEEPEPEIPADLLAALEASPASMDTWRATTVIARVDWIHWIVSAKQPATRAKRIENACEMLASGKKRVCCFDPSGFYSKAFHAPRAAN